MLGYDRAVKVAVLAVVLPPFDASVCRHVRDHADDDVEEVSSYTQGDDVRSCIVRLAGERALDRAGRARAALDRARGVEEADQAGRALRRLPRRPLPAPRRGRLMTQETTMRVLDTRTAGIYDVALDTVEIAQSWQWRGTREYQWNGTRYAEVKPP
jgi:hypothetical protein